jgi:aminoglycoside 3-N-acetyltransferase
LSAAADGLSMAGMRQLLVDHLPEPLLARLRVVRRHGRRARYHVRESVAPVTVSRADFAAALRAAGLREGEGVFVHTAMSRFGQIEGGPATVVGALEDVLGDRGLIAMPAFPLTASTADHLAADPVFDVRTTPSRMGALTEHFRKLPGVRRSLHPTHPVCARGPGADALVAGHADAPTPFGAGTPFARMVEPGMRQLWLGTGLGTFTLYHAFECLRGDAFPYRVFAPDRVRARCVDHEGRERIVPTLVHDPELGSRKDPTRDRIREHLLATGVMRSVTLGRGEILAAPLPELFRELDVLMARGITIYAVEPPGAAGKAA